MKISRVSCWVLRLPIEDPVIKKTINSAVNFVEIETDDGLKGHAMAEYPMAYGIKDFINREIAPIMVGKDPIRIEDIHTKILLQLARKYFAGSFSNSVSLINIALWDIKGKATGQPVWKLLGGARNPVPAYFTFGFHHYTKDQLVARAKELVAEGQDKLKMVVAGSWYKEQGVADTFGMTSSEDILKDAERVKAVREAVGNQVKIMIDANKGLTLTQAIHLAKLIEPYNITWFEDPIHQGDSRLMAQLRKKITIPIAAGSTGTSDLLYFREYLLNEAVDFIQPNVRDIGGFTGALKAAALAQSFNIQLQMGGNWPHINMHLHAGVPNGGMVEFHYKGTMIVLTYFDDAPKPVNGWITLPDTPGLGFTPKEGITKEFAVD